MEKRGVERGEDFLEKKREGRGVDGIQKRMMCQWWKKHSDLQKKVISKSTDPTM